MKIVVAENCHNMIDVLGSEDELWFGVDFLERSGGAFFEYLLGWEALVFVEIVGGHATSESGDIISAELG